MSSLGTLLSSSILIFEVLLQGVDFVVEDGYDLLARDAFEVVQELVDGRAVFESFEKRGDGEPGVLEDPRSADFVRASFDGVATVPVAHGAAFVIADIKMCKNAEIELTQPKVVASSADTRRRRRRHIAKGGSSERDLRDERRWPFDPGDRQGAGGIAEHGAPVSAIAGGDAVEGAATQRVEAGSVHRVHRRADGGGVGKLRGAAPGVDRLGL